ncbi:LPS-assembly protein [Defluviimonas denitrificans]|jgi:LPS-assembly protein|uniref:LPS-assembly protein LptD n=1 Tax=Albidovulum denitrificans TaxID=404881 RepID=A0A2S8SD33_9RHOB|nr:LPS assembly protein LptD [Defluviimonas denitrificans]PQV58716.1 LPS-assembly protein [Defluviimonas denitrificans]
MRHGLYALFAAALIGLATPRAGHAQDQATLVADRVFLTGDNLLTAEGAVEAFYKDARVKAARIVYDARTETLDIAGPITLTDASGTVILADSAHLSRDLQNGLLKSARMVMDQQLQLAALEISRIDGRYTRMDKVVASSCQVCPSNPVPLWEIRARRVVHDQLERQIYFDHAQFRIAGVPVFYLPRLRMPDPTLKRATGFLQPEVRTTSELGPGLKLPYFIALGDHRDLTVTPYASTTRTRTLGLRYRQAFATGTIEANGALSDDDIRPGKTRGYLFLDGTFALPRDFKLGIDLQTVSDPAYLLDYGVTDTDWLTSGVSVERARRNEYAAIGVYHHRSLRPGDDNATLPNLATDLEFERRFSPRYLGGEGRLSFQLHGHRRSSTLAFDANGDGIVDGRDVSRATLSLGWHKSWVMPNGMVFSGATDLTADVYSISQDVTFPGSVTRFLPQAAVELRWPWVRSSGNGASQVIEPVVQLVLAPDRLHAVPNEDSTVATLDEGNLFSFSRFPGADGRELGNRLNIGLGWTRYDPAGWSLGVTGGRVFRARDLGQFTPGSGLDGRSSDWLVSAQVQTDGGLSVQNRVLFDNGFDVSRNELNFGLVTDRYSVDAGYLWMVADPAEGRPTATSELVLDAGWDMANNWRGQLAGRYDFNSQRAARAEFGLSYLSECVAVDLSLSRRFTSSTSVAASTDFNLSVSLVGFGAGTGGSARKSCAR